MVNRAARTILWWRNSSLLWRLFYFVLLSALLASFLYIQIPDLESDLFKSNLVFFILINVAIIGLGVLAVIIGRNVAKLIFDRQEGILGSKLRTKLVLAFIGLTLIPTVILFILASGLISSAMEGWFNRQVEEVVNSSIDVAKDHYNSIEDLSLRFTLLLKQELQSRKELEVNNKEIVSVLDNSRKAYGAYSIRLYDGDRQQIAESVNVTSVIEDFKEPPVREEYLQRALNNEDVVSFEEEGVRQFVRIYSTLSLMNQDGVLMVTFRISPELSSSLGSIISSYDEYKKLNFYKQPLKSSYVLALALITGLILFAAIWFGFYMAREITVPIERLAEGTKEVSQGNYDIHIRLAGDDEIGFLITSFNKMTKDLKTSQSEIEQRKIYLETILSNLSVGVIATDYQMNVTLVNQLIKDYLKDVGDKNVVGLNIFAVLQDVLANEVMTLLEHTRENLDIKRSEPIVSSSKPVKFIHLGRELQIVCSVEPMFSLAGKHLGYVFIFEDVTEIAQAHQMAAWREVARRIAHEIKNPLTPIQLSAQRLERLFKDTPQNKELTESSQVILENVESIKRLANEFSNFARMPTAQMTSSDLNTLISDTLESYVEQNQDIMFQFIADLALPTVSLDQEQIRRMFMNLLDNSVAAVTQQTDEERGKIVVKTILNEKQDKVIVEISDNGIGIIPAHKTRIFEPYFTTKKEGTGLGLAIVSSVVSDHRGTIRVYDNQPRGTKLIIELPVKQSKSRVVESGTDFSAV